MLRKRRALWKIGQNLRIGLILLLCGHSSLALAQNWAGFRGPQASGIADGQDLPTDWELESGRNLRWKTAIPGLSHSSPIVWENRIYLTSVESASDGTLILGDVDRAGIATADDLVSHRWSLYAIDPANGEILWRKVVHEGVPRLKRHVKASHSSQTPATDGRRIVALLGSEGLFCFDMEGNLLWRKDIGLLDVGYWGQPEFQWGAASSPVLFGDLVFVQNDRQKDSFLAAYRLEDGQEVWRHNRDEKPSWATPLLVEHESQPELVTNSGNYLRGHDPLTGRELWRLSNQDAEVIVPSPIASGELIIITGGYPTGGRPIVAIRQGSRGEIPAQPDPAGGLAWKAERGSPYTPTPIAYRGLLYSPVDNGILSAYDLRSGERIYRTRLEVGSGFSASPVASDGHIYFPGEDGLVYVVAAGPEFRLLSRNDLGEPLMASPAISSGLLIMRGRNHLFGIGQTQQQ